MLLASLSPLLLLPSLQSLLLTCPPWSSEGIEEYQPGSPY
uniref:Uncharacterized protein n=1 Tax=Tetranychus urticae TaxID=32264 RepID=T1K0X2_TETUR